MRYPHRLVRGTFLLREKRFLAHVELAGGDRVIAHLANTGSMRACTAPRAPVRLSRSDNPRRKLPWSVEQIQVAGHWILVNTARPNALVAEALVAGRVPWLSEVGTVRREVAIDDGRLDFRVALASGPCWIEVKNATMFEGGSLWFPDAVTARGARHVRALTRLRDGGDRAVLLFCVGHTARAPLRLAEHIDPDYAAAVREAARRGVEVHALRCHLDDERAEVGEPVEVLLR